MEKGITVSGEKIGTSLGVKSQLRRYHFYVFSWGLLFPHLDSGYALWTFIEPYNYALYAFDM